jgi:hypothetical protein
MKQLVLALSLFIGSVGIGTTASNAAVPGSTAITNATALSSLVKQVVVYRSSVYRGTRYGGCRRVRTCGPNGCVYVRRCW